MTVTDSGPAGGPVPGQGPNGRRGPARQPGGRRAADGGTAGPNPRIVAVWAAVIVVLLAVAGVVITLVAQNRSDTLSYGTKSFAVTAPGVLTVTFAVDKAPTTELRCSVVAQDIDHVVVGEVDDVEVAARDDGRRGTTVSVDVPVRGTPVTGSVTDCRVARTH